MLKQIEGSRAVAEAVAMSRPDLICAGRGDDRVAGDVHPQPVGGGDRRGAARHRLRLAENPRPSSGREAMTAAPGRPEQALSA